MSGVFGVVSNGNCVNDVFFGTDYHSHLGDRRGGMAIYGQDGFSRSIHNIQTSPFRTKFEKDILDFEGNFGIGCISDTDPQPLLVNSPLGNFAIVTVGRINNVDQLVKESYEYGRTHFLEMSGGHINCTELVASLISRKKSIIEGLQYVQEVIEGSMSVLLMTAEGIYAARDKLGRTPLSIGKKEGAHCVSFESFAYVNLGYCTEYELGPGEIVFINPTEMKTLVKAGDKMKICSFLWVYYGYPTSTYEGVNVETMRYRCGEKLAMRDKGNVFPDCAAGVPDSGLAHAIGYANASGIPFNRPFIKYTPTWSRSFMGSKSRQRHLVAHMKLIPVDELIRNKKLLLIDDSIVRGTQLSETIEFLYNSGAKEVNVRTGCPPLLFACKYLNFSPSQSIYDLITRRIIAKREGENVSDELLADYANPDSQNYKEMVAEIGKELKFRNLEYLRLDDMISSIGIEPCKLCTYCWNGKE